MAFTGISVQTISWVLIQLDEIGERSAKHIKYHLGILSDMIVVTSVQQHKINITQVSNASEMIVIYDSSGAQNKIVMHCFHKTYFGNYSHNTCRKSL